MPFYPSNHFVFLRHNAFSHDNLSSMWHKLYSELTNQLNVDGVCQLFLTRKGGSEFGNTGLAVTCQMAFCTHHASHQKKLNATSFCFWQTAFYETSQPWQQEVSPKNKEGTIWVNTHKDKDYHFDNSLNGTQKIDILVFLALFIS